MAQIKEDRWPPLQSGGDIVVTSDVDPLETSDPRAQKLLKYISAFQFDEEESENVSRYIYLYTLRFENPGEIPIKLLITGWNYAAYNHIYQAVKSFEIELMPNKFLEIVFVSNGEPKEMNSQRAEVSYITFPDVEILEPEWLFLFPSVGSSNLWLPNSDFFSVSIPISKKEGNITHNKRTGSIFV